MASLSFSSPGAAVLFFLKEEKEKNGGAKKRALPARSQEYSETGGTGDGQDHLRGRPDGVGQDGAGGASGQSAGRRGRLLRLDADLPPHGRRHGQTGGGGDGRRAASYDRHCSPGGGFFRWKICRACRRGGAGHPRARQGLRDRGRNGPVCRQPDRRSHLRARTVNRQTRSSGGADARRGRRSAAARAALGRPRGRSAAASGGRKAHHPCA